MLQPLLWCCLHITPIWRALIIGYEIWKLLLTMYVDVVKESFKSNRLKLWAWKWYEVVVTNNFKYSESSHEYLLNSAMGGRHMCQDWLFFKQRNKTSIWKNWNLHASSSEVAANHLHLILLIDILKFISRPYFNTANLNGYSDILPLPLNLSTDV